MRIFWTPEAVQDRERIWDYIVARNPQAAIDLDDLFGEVISMLSDHPKMGRKGKISRTRELLPHKNYRIIYEVKDDIVWILAIVHAVQQWPPLE